MPATAVLRKFVGGTMGRHQVWVLSLAVLLVVSAQAATADWVRVWSHGNANAHLSMRAGSPATSLPLVLVVAACEAERTEQAYWAATVERWGFAAAQLDAVGLASTCNALTPYDTLDATSPPLTIAIDSALAHLRTLKHTVPDRIAVLGFTRSGIMQVFAERQERPWRDRPAAGIAFAPDCRYPLNARFSTPTLTLAGGQDSEEERNCSRLMRRSSVGRAPIVRRVYPNADPDFTYRVLAASALTSSTLANSENQAALEAAADAVREFLDAYLRAEQLQAITAQHTTHTPASLQVSSSRDPGWTLLDHVLEDGTDIPFPFSALVARLSEHAGPGYFDRAAVKQTAIPLGRSLQRDANRGDFFGSPRIVLAVDTEPADPRRHVNLKDRLFLGYQPAAGVVEAISWSPASGRFEFQIIDDYKAGATPKLRSANRELCVSCHQNHAPMFSLAPWSETDANPRIAARLQARQGIVGRTRLNTIVEHIDAATDRASLMAQAHEVWRRACGADTHAGRRCRAAWVTAMLQYRLTGEGTFERQTEQYQADFKAHLAQRWRELWPHGVALASADLRDHDPLVMPYLGFVPPHVDPISARSEAALWARPDDDTIETLVRSLARLFDTRLINEIDDFLSATAGFRRGQSVSMPCDIRTRPALAPLERVGAFCTSGDGETKIELDFVMRGHKVVEGVAHRVQFGGARFRPALVLGGRIVHRVAAVQKAGLESTRSEVPVARLVMKQRGSGLRIRLPRGDSMRIAEVSLPAADGPGHLQLLVSDDFAAVEATVTRLAVNGSPAFVSPVFRPAMVLGELFDALQMGAGPNVPDDPRRGTALSTAFVPETPAAATAAGLALLKQTCGSCHAQPTVSPPGFLHGDDAAVARQLQACTPRMWARLHAWTKPESERASTPMPPPHIVALRGDALSHWPHSLTYRRLTGYVASLLPASGSGMPTSTANVERSCTHAVAALATTR